MNRWIVFSAGLILLQTISLVQAQEGDPKPLVYSDQTARVLRFPPERGESSIYTSNRDPLVPNRLLKLPSGSIRPLGWVRYQMQELADGLTGRLDEISPFCKAQGNAWLDPAGMGHSYWEEVPYWLRGLTHLAYSLDDTKLKKKALSWLKPIMKHQRMNGYFGTEENFKYMDLWPNMLILDALKVHHEATGDPSVLEFMTRYFKFQRDLDPNLFLFRSWQKIRGGDNLESIYWLYNRTGEKALLDLARRNHQNTVEWVENIPTPHGVNITQGFKEPAIFYQQSHDEKMLASATKVYRSVVQYFGRQPGGMFGADEICRQGYDGPRQGAETCSMLEFINSHTWMAGLTGDAQWSDRCEAVAFNSLPSAFTADLKALHYLTAPNQVVLDRKNKSPMINNEGEMFSYRPTVYRCCAHNAGLGWPVFAESLMMATRDGGLAAVLYSPCETRARVGSGKTGSAVTLLERTEYPFKDEVEFEVRSAKSVRFPLYLRVPGWCEAPEFEINGKRIRVKTKPLDWVVIDRQFQPGDIVKVRLPMVLKVVNFDPQRASLSVLRGPLAYSLKIEEKWKKFSDKKNWPGWKVYPSSLWNYGLVPDEEQLRSGWKVVEKPMAPNRQVFTIENAPIEITAIAKLIPSWKLEKNGMVQEIGSAPVTVSTVYDTVKMVPMGCSRLRVTVFPRVYSMDSYKPGKVDPVANGSE